MHVPGSRFYRYGVLALTIISIVVLALPTNLQAVDIAPATSPAFLQTSGPRTTLGTGDFYTNVNGANNAQGHDVEILVPCTWPGATPVTFAIFDPEVFIPNRTTPPIIDDEIRNAANNEVDSTQPITTFVDNADNTQFTLIAPGGATVGPVTFTPQGGSNLLWVELATVTPNAAGYGCGSYTVRTTTGTGGTLLQFNNDDNAWRLRVISDPDCTVSPGTCSGIGAAQSALIGNSNGLDDLDGQPGTGDEVLIGMIDASFQHTAPASSSCLDLYEFVDGLVSPVRIHNFDMDESNSPSNISVTYFPPPTSNYAPSVVGVTSENSDWNPPPANGTPPPRGGDSFVIDGNDIGWWRIRTCVQNDNQYIVEGQLGVPAFFTQPPTPRMALSKTNPVTQTLNGEVLTYTLRFTNTSNLTPFPGPATNVILTDTLPVDLTFMNCAVLAPLAGTCAHNGVNPGGRVTFTIATTLKPGESGALRVVSQVNNSDGNPTNPVVNVATLTYKDPLKNTFPPITSTVSIPTPISLAGFGTRRLGDGVRVNWRTGTEEQTAGFHLLRSTSPDLAGAARVTADLIPARGAGSTYAWTDTAAAPDKVYYYWLQATTLAGGTSTYGPIFTAGSAAAYRQFLPFIGR
ncbi:MAG TPA: hypothetical protein VD886_13475 [Herpetosiphonaceae bacterium]|nr:hypothetical protein [Herpetosiphonaceae bacterium]